MPLVDVEAAGLESGAGYPWADKNDVVGVECAIVQAWGYLPDDLERSFQVCFLLQPLRDAFMQDGESLPEIFGVSFDAATPDNPRRRYLAHFEDPKADPVGPVALQQVPSNNQQGWVWAFRKAPMPTEAIEAQTDPQRILYRQNWKADAKAAHERRNQKIRERNRPARAALDNGGDIDELPF